MKATIKCQQVSTGAIEEMLEATLLHLFKMANVQEIKMPMERVIELVNKRRLTDVQDEMEKLGYQLHKPIRASYPIVYKSGEVAFQDFTAPYYHFHINDLDNK